jgi:hypothetical protein
MVYVLCSVIYNFFFHLLVSELFLFDCVLVYWNCNSTNVNFYLLCGFFK